MIKYFSLLLMCVTSLYAMEADAPHMGAHETGSSSSSSVAAPHDSNENKSSPLPQEIMEEEIIKGRSRAMDRLTIALRLLPTNDHESTEKYVERTCNFVGAKKVYFNDFTKELLNREDPVRVNSAPTSLFFSTRPTPQEIEKLAQKFPNIDRVDMSDSVTIRVPHIQALSTFQHLQHFCNQNNIWFADEEAQILAQQLQGLRTLEIPGSMMGNEGIIAIAQGLPHLTQLDLSGSIMENEGIIAIAQGLPHLTQLKLMGTVLQNEDMLALARGLPSLRTLALSIGTLETRSIRSIAGGFPVLDNLRIHFSFDQTTEKSNAVATALAQHFKNRRDKGFSPLKTLTLTETKMTDEGIIEIAQNLTSLESLTIMRHAITGNTLRAIGSHLTNLKSLTVANSPRRFSFDDVQYLLTHLPNLEEAWIGQTPINIDERNQLRAMWKGSPSKLTLH